MARLGYQRYGAQGGDWGSRVSMGLGLQHADHVIGIHLNYVAFRDPRTAGADGDFTEPERAALAALDYHLAQGSGYASLQSTRPQTAGYGLVDSPAALAAWITEKFCVWSDCDGNPDTVFTRDEMLDNLMLYWLPGTGASSARLYWESLAKRITDPVSVPAGCSIFPRELYRPSRRWVQWQFPDLRYWNELDKGGHFPAFEQPETFVSDVRAAFRQFR
jgi:epoxide hydrolase